MQTIIFFPGLATNDDLFSKIDIHPLPRQIINYPIPGETESLEAYVKRLQSNLVSTTPLIYVGVSLGGILAQELSKSIPAKKTIIISSISSLYEKPFFFNLAKWFPFYKRLSDESLKNGILMIGRFFTNKDPEELKLFES
ncbi:MAG: hypothetical protein H0V61_05035, partial [Chitinophagales bacterium]|nr:hypothetical protein [Chitinophagales bacterium]